MNGLKQKKFYDCYTDVKYDREFLKSHTVYRSDFAHWCSRSGIPLPEFWFPAGWVVHELNEKDQLAETDQRKSENSVVAIKQEPTQKLSGKRIDANEEIWKPAIIAAKTIWAQDKSLLIADVTRKIKAMPELKASAFTESAIRKRIRFLSPTPGTPGRKPKKKLI